jgi:hypothetical protein
METKHFRWFNKMEMGQNIMDVEAVYLQQDLASVFQREKMLRQQQQPEIKNATLYLLSDFQKNTSFNTQIEVDTSLKVRLLPMQNNPVNNLSIDSVYFHDPVQLPQRESGISVLLSNNGTEDQNSIPLKLFVNDEQKAVLSVDLEAGQTSEFEISFSNEYAGKKMARLEIDDYPIVYDDRLYFAFEVRQEFQVGIISKQQANPYLKKLYEEDSLISLFLFRQNSVDYNQLPQQDLLVLDELTSLSSGLQNELQKYLQKGGNLLVIPSLETKLNPWLNSLACPTYQNLIETPTRLESIDKEMNYFNRVFEKQWSVERKNQKIDLPEIRQFFEMELSANSSRLLQSRSEQALLLSTKVEQGQVYQLAFPLNLSASELPKHALFVPVFYQMILQSGNQRNLYETLGSGEPIRLSSAGFSNIRGGDLVPQLQMGTESWIPQMRMNRNSEMILSQIDWPSDGIADLKNQEKIIDQIAVNYDRKESDFRVWSKEELSDLIAENNWPGFQIIKSTPDKITAQLIELNQAQQLWKWFLILAVFFIFVETLILRLWK